MPNPPRRRPAGDRRTPQQPPRRPRRAPTEAEKRAAEVKLRRPKRDELNPRIDKDAREPDRWIPERWEDEGPLRAAAEQATARGRSGEQPGPARSPLAGSEVGDARSRRSADPGRLDPSWLESVKREADPRAASRAMERLAAAAEALERDRYRDALRMVSSVIKIAPTVGAAHEVAGIAHYRLGEWRKAAAELEQARALHPTPDQLPVLADCYRALRRYREVDELWQEIREMSPSPAVMAEGRIVAAGALADRGDLQGALRMMLRVADAPKRVREHHLRQWYVIADLYDRLGDIIRARHFFQRIATIDAQYADVQDRLATLGRR